MITFLYDTLHVSLSPIASFIPCLCFNLGASINKHQKDEGNFHDIELHASLDADF